MTRSGQTIMVGDGQTGMAWKGDRTFVVSHVLLPALAAIAILLLAERSSLDLTVANLWYQLEGGQWAWRDNWYAYDLIHHYGKQAVILIGVVVAGVFTLGFFIERLQAWRRRLGYLLLCMTLIPASIAMFKSISPIPCPWDLLPFGGDLVYLHTSAYAFGSAETGHCFPSGHASGGFALISAYFAAFGHSSRRSLWLAPGLLTGWVFALGQQSRGAHFLSHDIWTLAYCWFAALLLFLLIRPDLSRVSKERMAGPLSA